MEIIQNHSSNMTTYLLLDVVYVIFLTTPTRCLNYFDYDFKEIPIIQSHIFDVRTLSSATARNQLNRVIYVLSRTCSLLSVDHLQCHEIIQYLYE